MFLGHFTRSIFDWRLPSTYIFAFIIELCVGAYLAMVALILMLHGIGSCCLLLTFIDDVDAELNTLNEYKKMKEIRMKIRGDLSKFIKFQSKIKQLRCLWIFLLSDYKCPYFVSLSECLQSLI